MWYSVQTDTLCHYGTKGMHWGIRKVKNSISSKSFGTVKLGAKEYAHVMSELITNITEEQKQHSIINKPIGDFVYTFENNHNNDYRVIGKKAISTSINTIRRIRNGKK